MKHPHPLVFAKGFATRLANQGHIAAGEPVYLTQVEHPHLTRFTGTYKPRTDDDAIKKRETFSVYLYLVCVPGAVEFVPTGRSSLRPL